MIRKEPRSMTLGDAMSLAAGFALMLTLSFRGGAVGGGSIYVVPEPWVMLVFLVAWSFWLVAASASVVVAARLVRYRRSPRPAEWLAILIALIGQQSMGPMRPIDMMTRSLPFDLMGALDTYSSWRWTTAGLITAIVVLGLGVLRLLRSFLPPWAKTAWLSVLAYLTLAGPVSTIGTNGVDFLAPSTGFGPGRLPMLYWLACQLLATTPMALMLGIPAVGSLLERIRRVRWRWTEWACAMASVMIALALSPLYQGNFPYPSIGWMAERGLVGAWLLGVGLLSRVVLGRLGPAWSRWLGDQAEGPGSTSIDDSPARTLPT